MTFDEWREKHGPNGGAYDVEMQLAGWNGRQPQVDDLVSLVGRLVHSLKKANPDSELPAKAVDYLRRNDLMGSPMREVKTCPVCNYRSKPNLPAGENKFWECSHVECPNRHKVTAAPSDRPPTPKEIS